MRGVGDVLMWVAWVAWLHWWRASMCSVDRVGGMLAWVAWWHAINIVIAINITILTKKILNVYLRNKIKKCSK